MADHASRSHKKFAASAAERWWNCPGSIRLCDGVEEKPSPYAEEGTRAHEWLELKLVGGSVPKHEPTDEMLDAIDVFKAEVKAIPPGHWRQIVEKQVVVKGTAAGDDIGGTADFAVYREDLRKLWLIDFKFGAGVAVEAKGNIQLRNYDLGLIDTYGWAPIEVENVIVQPRAFHPEGPVRRETLSIAELYDFRVENEEAVERCLQPDAPLVPGEAQCRWCPAKTFCPALESRALAVAGETFSSVKQITPGSLPDPKGLTPDRIGHILAARKLLIDWLEAVEEEGFSLATTGTHIPGQKLVAAIGRRQWDSGEDDKITAYKLAKLTKDLTPSDFLVEKLVGITDAEKKIKAHAADKKAAAEQFAFLTTKVSSGKLQLVSEDDRRPAVNPASDAFAGVVQLPHITGE